MLPLTSVVTVYEVVVVVPPTVITSVYPETNPVNP
jgi:hypothetical protein